MVYLKRLLAVLLCVLAMVTCVFAGEISPNTANCSLTVNCAHDLSEVNYAIWRVASVDEDVTFALTPGFAASRADVNNTELWPYLAEALAGYTDVQQVSANARATTDRSGYAYFSGLATGLYLVRGETYLFEGKTYEPSPFLIALPTRSDNTTPWQYQVITQNKPSELVQDQTVDVSVLKIWSGDDDTAVRPAGITVHLLQDGRIFDTIVLDSYNNWSFTWTKLESGHSWRVAEGGLPEHYTVQVRRDGHDFVIINTYTQPETPPTPDTPDPEKPDPPKPDSPTLPETGTLQWIVPLLLGAGAMLFLLGLLKRRQESK